MKRQRVKLRILGKRIKQLRESKIIENYGVYNEKEYFDTKTGITQEELSYELNVSLDTIKNWEQGYNYPTFDMLVSISTFFDCDIEYLLGRQEHKRKELGKITEICGLSENAVSNLVKYKESGYSDIISNLLENEYIIQSLFDCCTSDYNSMPAVLTVVDPFNKNHRKIIRPAELEKIEINDLCNDLKKFVLETRKEKA